MALDKERSSDDWPGSLPGIRTISDANTMRALAHPVRIALIEALSLGGPMTATELGEQIGETPTTCSFHLRQLAKYGFVEEAGGGKGRARPWRMPSIGFQMRGVQEDPEADVAATALTGLWRERLRARYETWRQTRSAYPPRWRTAADDTEYVMYLTADELEEVTRQLHAVLLPRFQDGRLTDPSKRPAGALPVEVLLFAFPLKPPETAPGDEPNPEDGT